MAWPLGGAVADPASARGQREWTRVQLSGRPRAAVVRALRGASRRLQQPSCQALLEDFRATTEASPGERLRALGLTPSEFLEVMVFSSGRGRGRCSEPGVVAVTSPSSRVVRICEERFDDLATRDLEVAEATLIHEALHSLGVAEDPPSSREITRRVLARCGDVALAAERHAARACSAASASAR